MKRQFMTLMLMLTLTLGVGAATQQAQPDSAAVELTDSTRQDEVEAYSDTTAVDTGRTTRVVYSSDDFTERDLFEFFDKHADNYAGLMAVLGVIVFLFIVLGPILVLALLFYFIYKNRKQRLQFAQQAMQQGQPIPEQMMQPQPPTDVDLWTKGMRQVFLGVGLAVFLGAAVGRVGFGIGALVLCIGAGNLVIARRQKEQENRFGDNLG